MIADDTSSGIEWVVESRPIMPELTDDYGHADYTPTPVGDKLAGVTVEQRLDEVMRERIHELFGQVV